ncbi:MAG: hypothetical protein HY952_11995 [Elusimicrobia bacterium]|nr:hypothetical protein [Elusimicrobiota bacterium]
MDMLKSALIILLAAAPAFSEGLPEFNLNAMRATDIRDHSLNPSLWDGIRDYDRLPGAPQPVCVRVDGLPLPKGFTPPVPTPRPEPAGVYRTYDPGLPTPLSKGGYIQINSATKLKMNKEKGELAVTFPDVDFGGGSFGGQADLYVRVIGTDEAPAVSWATVICGSGNFMGYKGSTVDFPQQSGSVSINETLALGSPKALIVRTHRWLAGDLVALEDLCTDAFRERQKDYRAETLPASLGKYKLEFNARKNTLKVKW